MPNPQRFCAFCLGNKRSKEHFWPKWARGLLPDSENYTIQRGKGKGPLVTVRMGQGSLRNTKMRVVCQRCNNEWMSRMETAVQPILTPLMFRKPFIVDGPMQGTLARWIALKAMILDQSDVEDIVVRQEDRDALMGYGLVPENMKIRIAMCGVDGWQSMAFRESIKAARTPIEPSGGKNCHAITFCIGDLLIHVTISYALDFDLDDFVPIAESVVRLWPKSRDVILWPAGPVMTLERASALIRRVDVLRWRPNTHADA